jgi:SAM-dependent methyltransferase
MKRNSLSALDAIRAELQTCTDSIERVNLARRCRELPGSMFELVSELPDAETARRKLRTEKDPRTQDLGKEYQQRFAALAPYRDSVWQVLVRDFLQHYVDPSATVLDLGSGWGEFIRHIHAHRRIAMDLNPDMPSRVGSGVEVILQDCSQTWQVADSSLDVVFTSNFFEHLPDKDALRRTLQEALRCLKDGGRIICLGPNIRFLHGAYWDFWDHFLPLTDRSMIEILTLTGFALERVEPRFLPYSMSQGFTPPIGFITLYLRLPFLWRILGKQFLLVARKA